MKKTKLYGRKGAKRLIKKGYKIASYSKGKKGAKILFHHKFKGPAWAKVGRR